MHELNTCTQLHQSSNRSGLGEAAIRLTCRHGITYQNGVAERLTGALQLQLQMKIATQMYKTCWNTFWLGVVWWWEEVRLASFFEASKTKAYKSHILNHANQPDELINKDLRMLAGDAWYGKLSHSWPA